jgi:polyhydroxyalkanoate synthesis repressor PhaR
MGRIRRGKDEPVIIKKYANRRLYDTGKSSYVTLEDLYEMVKDDMEFIVQDAKTGENLTNSVLNQIISEQESRGPNLLPTNFLRKLIGFYGDNMGGFVSNYLESAMDMFVTQQERMRDQMKVSFDPMKGFLPGTPGLEEINKKNMAMLERSMQAMKIFTPFKMPGASNGASRNNGQSHNSGGRAARDERAAQIDNIKRKIAEMENELSRLSS